MNELKTLKNLLLDVLSNQGGTYQRQAINAINAIKFDQEITAPIIINQSISVLNVSIQQRIVKAVKMLDRSLIETERALIEKTVKQVDKLIENEGFSVGEMFVPKVTLPIDMRSAVNNYKAALIDKAMKMTAGNTAAAARLLNINRTTLVAHNQRRGIK